MLAQLAFNLRLKSGGEETSRYAVKPKGGVSAAATKAEGNNVCVAISSAEHRKQVALQRVATQLLYTLTGQAHTKIWSLHGRVHTSSARA